MEHHHNHSHNHDFSDKDEALALIKYMASHNESHTSELSDLCNKISTLNADAAKLIESAISEYSKGNDLLKSALQLLEKGE